MFAGVRRSTIGGPRAFGVIWSGQLISYIGSGLTSFALGVWAYQMTDSITLFALIALFRTLPGVLLGPLAGALVDRWDRRRAMLVSDMGAGLSTLFIALQFVNGQPEMWHIYLAVFVSGAFGALRFPALTAATTQLVPKEQFGRTSGLLQIVQVGQVLVSPIAAGALIDAIKLEGVILIDFTTFLFAILSLLIVSIPRPPVTAEGLAGKGSLWREIAYGWTYITARAGLLALMVTFSIANFMLEMISVLLTPLLLSFASPSELGLAMSLGGIGYLAGSLVMSAWGGFKRRINTVIISLLLVGLFTTLMGLQASVPLVAVSIFLVLFCVPIVVASNQVIWQSKVAPDVQGRVFAIRRTIILATPPLAYAVAGPLADTVFEPLVAESGPLAGSIGQIIGVGQGRGIGLLIISMGLLVMLVSAISYLYPRLRLVEDELPDAVAGRPAAAEPSGPVVNAAAN